jgi:hypothetical protein
MDNNIKNEVIDVLECLKKDAEMALSGEWDCTKMEGRETGFEAHTVRYFAACRDLLYRQWRCLVAHCAASGDW